MFSRFRRTERKGPVPSVVILGGGYGGVHAALELQRAARRGEIELTLISRENFFLFQPMLAEVISGSIGPLSVVSPVRRLVPHANVHQAEIESVDTDSQAVAIRYPGHARLTYIPYDHLIFAVGSATDLSQFPGVEEHAMSLQGRLGDAFRLRNHLISHAGSGRCGGRPVLQAADSHIRNRGRRLYGCRGNRPRLTSSCAWRARVTATSTPKTSA